MNTVLLIGGSGLLGTALVPALRAAGWQVRLTLRGEAPPWLAESSATDEFIQTLVWAGGDSPLPLDYVADCQAVINLAGASIADGRWTAARKELLRSSRIQTTRQVALAIAAVNGQQPEQPVAVLINASGVSIYGSHCHEVDESSELGESNVTENFLATLARDWETAVSEHAPSALRTVCLRLGVILAAEGGALGKMVPNWLPRLLPLTPLAGGSQGLPWVHIADAVDMICAAVGDARWQGAVNVVAPELVSNAGFTRVAAAVSGHPYFPLGPAAWALRLLLGEQAQLVSDDIWAQPRRAQDWGYAWHYPELRGALESCLKR